MQRLMSQAERSPTEVSDRHWLKRSLKSSQAETFQEFKESVLSFSQ